MDANGTKFHLTHTVSDWEQWRSFRHDVTLREVFADPATYADADIEWNPREANLRLARQAVTFRSAIEQPSTILENRRGAGRDRYGHWYWIDDERRGIRFCANGDSHSVAFWPSLEDDLCEPPASDLGKAQFRTLAPPAPEPLTLSGLAVTDGHYLVVGAVRRGL